MNPESITIFFECYKLGGGNPAHIVNTDEKLILSRFTAKFVHPKVSLHFLKQEEYFGAYAH